MRARACAGALVAAWSLGLGCDEGPHGADSDAAILDGAVGDASRDGATDWNADAAMDASRDDGSMGVVTHDGGDGDAGDDDAGDDLPDPPEGLCDALACGGGVCEEAAGSCRCAAGEFFGGTGCAATRACLADGSCVDVCAIPQAQVLDVVVASETLSFSAPGGGLVQVGVALDPTESTPDAWLDASTLALADYADSFVRVFARVKSASCTATHFFSRVYEVRSSYPGPAGAPGSTAIDKADAAFVAWATSVVSVSYGSNVDASWRTPDEALGPAVGDSFDVVSLGDGGSIVLGFQKPITDAGGADFAVFENGFDDTWLELGQVEVSSDGVSFAAFDGASLEPASIGAYGTLSTTQLHGFAGKYKQGKGMPFDLALLRQHPLVVSGSVNLLAISHVRILDIAGDGNTDDAFGRAVYDPYPGTSSAGFDLDAIGVLHEAP